jgi:RNA polymerase sigma-70 factor (ECF subfamily)
MFFSTSGKDSGRSDEWYIARFRKKGDLEDLGKLYERYMHLVYGVCIKYLKDREAARDAVMHIFEKLIIEIPKRQIENFKPWLYVLTKNHCLMQLRAGKAKTSQKEKMLADTGFFMENSYELHPDNEQALERDLAVMKKCIELLKQQQKECVKLFYLEEKSYREISGELDIELKKVKSLIQNGKRNLKICIENNG